MTIIGADLSSYDPDEAAGEYPFVILNVEDPRMAHKADIAHAAGVPIMLYSWVYPGDNGYSVTRSYAAEELLAVDGIRVLHHWLDYEQKGVGPQNLEQAGHLVDPSKAPVGTYTYLSVLPQILSVLVGPLWLAYYPAGYQTVDYYAGMSGDAVQAGAAIHQWTSVGPPDDRDLNVILAERWWANLLSPVSAAPVSAPEDPEGGDNMLFVTNKEGNTAVFIRSGKRLFIRGFKEGTPAEALLLTDQCDPHNLDLKLVEGFGTQMVYAVGLDGKLVRCTGTAYGPKVDIV